MKIKVLTKHTQNYIAHTHRETNQIIDYLTNNSIHLHVGSLKQGEGSGEGWA